MHRGGTVFFALMFVLRGETVPFVGCMATGRESLKPPPKAGQRRVPGLSNAHASRLAYYAFQYGQEATPPGVLAPRGWNCIAYIGSSGPTLIVSPLPEPRWGKLTGPAIVLQQNYNSGMMVTGELIARVFPHYRYRVKDFFQLYGRKYEFQPFPADQFSLRSPDLVEFWTPANTRGLGNFTESLPIAGGAIYGAAILGKWEDDSVLVSVRLSDASVAKAIVAEVIREWVPRLRSQ